MATQLFSKNNLTQELGLIHFTGIGGIGMSGIAEIMHNLGYKIQGSDITENANVERLRGLGIKVIIGQKGENLKGCSVIVVSSAIKNDNPEVITARQKSLPIVKRAEMLAEIMRLKTCIAIAGTHGKTTTTTMMTTMFFAAGLEPTFINGGIINAYGTNAQLGKSEWLIAEADESDGTFIKLPATIGIISNIDPEHLEYYGSFKKLQQAFVTFIQNVPFYGFCVACKDHKTVAKLIGKIADRKIITYGIETEADVIATNIKQNVSGSNFDVKISTKVRGGARNISNITLPIPGKHNILNSLAPIAVALQIGIDDTTIAKGYEKYEGVKRRFTKTGEVGGITIIDDYAHHPKEIEVTLNTAKEVAKYKNGKIIAVFQPHRYTRIHSLFEQFCTCFKNANTVIIADIYEAGEKPIKGINKEILVKNIKNAIALESPDQLPQMISKIAKTNDIVVCLGAGSITYWANSLPDGLRKFLDTNT